MRKLFLYCLVLLSVMLSSISLKANTSKAFLEDFEKAALKSNSNYDKIAFHFTMAHMVEADNKEAALKHLEQAKKHGVAINDMILLILEAKMAQIYGRDDLSREKLIEMESKMLRGNNFSIGLFYLYLSQNSEQEAPKFNYYWNIGVAKALLSRSPLLESSFYFLKYEALEKGMPEMAASFLDAASHTLAPASQQHSWLSIALGCVLGVAIIILLYLYSERNKSQSEVLEIEQSTANLALIKQQLLVENQRLIGISNEQTQTIEFLKKQLAETQLEVTPSGGNCNFVESVLKNNINKIESWSTSSSTKGKVYLHQISADLMDVRDLGRLKDLKVSQFDRFKLYDFYLAKVDKYSSVYKNLVFKYDHFIPKYFNGDLKLFDRTIETLINFGINFCPSDKINIQFRLKSFSEDNLNIEIDMHTPPRYLPLEFKQLLRKEFSKESFDEENYYFAKLFLLKEFANLQHGSFDAYKDHELNNIFTLSIPLKAEIVPETPIDSELEEAQKALQSLYNILLVEDNKINQMVVRNILEKEGYVIEVATDGEEAIHKINERSFSLVLMDIQMPKMDGLRTTEYIRKLDDVSKRNVPIVALTGSSFLSEKEKALMFGMNDHVAKPYNPKEILEVVEKHIGSRPYHLGA